MSYWQEDLDNGQLATLRAALDKAPYRREPLEKLVNTMAGLLDAAGRDYLRVSESLGKRGQELQEVKKKLADAERLGYQKQVDLACANEVVGRFQGSLKTAIKERDQESDRRYVAEQELGAAREMIERLQGAVNQARTSSCQASQRNVALDKKLDATQRELAEVRRQLNGRVHEVMTLEARLGIQQELNYRIVLAADPLIPQPVVMYTSAHKHSIGFFSQRFAERGTPPQDSAIVEAQTIESARLVRSLGSTVPFAVTLANVADDRDRLRRALKESAANGLGLAIELEKAQRVAEERLATLAQAGDSLEIVLERLDDATK